MSTLKPMSPKTLALQSQANFHELREEAASWYTQYRQQLGASQEEGVSDVAALTDADITQLVHELR